MGKTSKDLDSSRQNCRSGRNQNFHYRYWFRWGHRISDPIDSAPNNFLKTPQGKKCSTNWMKTQFRQRVQITGGQYHRLGATGEGLIYVFDRLQSIGQQKKREQLSTELPIDRYQIFVISGSFVSPFESFSSSAKIVAPFRHILLRNLFLCS